jgi:hypothetical protein
VNAIHGELSKRSRPPFPRARTDAPGRRGRGYAQLGAGGRIRDAGLIGAVLRYGASQRPLREQQHQHQHEQVEEEHRSGEKVCAPHTALIPHHSSARHHTGLRWERWKIGRNAERPNQPILIGFLARVPQKTLLESPGTPWTYRAIASSRWGAWDNYPHRMSTQHCRAAGDVHHASHSSAGRHLRIATCYRYQPPTHRRQSPGPQHPLNFSSRALGR